MSQGNYASVNGLSMYYETHGTGQPLVLLHDALSATGSSFGALLPELAQHRQVIAVEQQAHGRTADVDRPLRVSQLADDTIALLAQLDLGQVDLLGYGLGAAIALDIAIRRPDLVNKLVLASATYAVAGLHPEVLGGIELLTPESLAGSPFEREYLDTAPHPDDWSDLVAKVQDLDRHRPDFAPADIAAIAAPTLLIVGDSDKVAPEHAVAMFRLLGGGVVGDAVGLPRSQLAIVPGTTHISLVYRAELLVPMIQFFLNRRLLPT